MLLYAGEALIIISFLYFGRSSPSKILILNIVVSSIIFSLFFLDILIPKVDLKDKTQKEVGSLGLRWFFSSAYIIAAIAVMVIFNNYKPIDGNSQIIIQGVLFFLLAIGLYISMTAADKVSEVYAEEKRILNPVEDIRKAVKDVESKLNQIKDVPPEIISGIKELKENLRFISPGNNPDILELETNLFNEIKSVQAGLIDIPLNKENIIENIKNCERMCKELKEIYSN